MHQQQGGAGAELDGKIPIADGIHGIGGHLLESEQVRHVISVDGKTGPGQGGGPQGQYVDPLPAFREPLFIPLQHFKPGQHVMAEGNGLGDLQMGKAGHDGIRFPAGDIQQSGHDRRQQCADGVHFVPQVQPQVSRHLVVTGAAGVQFLADIADPLDQGGFDIHMHVFQFNLPLEFAGLDVFQDRLQPVHDQVAFPFTDRLHPGEHADMGDGTGDIVAV